MINSPSPDFERILEAGNNAPSGENCQPWHFVVRKNEIEVHLLPERDQSAYSWGQRTSYLANGAVIENMVIAASAEQYRAEVFYFPKKEDDMWHVATIAFAKDLTMKPDPLAPYVNKRISNRNSYKEVPITKEERERLLAVITESDSEFLVLTENREEMKLLGRVGSTNEEVMLANRSLHQFFFNHVNWTKEEDEQKKIGFYIKTLELAPPTEFMFKIFRNWNIMRVLNKIGFNRIAASENAKINASSAVIGALMVSNTEPLDFVKIGRTIERLWITATSLGLAFQPLTGLFFFQLKIDNGEGEIFAPNERKLIKDACERAIQIFDAKGKHIAFMFRLGRGDAPSAHAIRFPLSKVVEINS